MFKYSERPGTYAAKYLADNVPEETKTTPSARDDRVANSIIIREQSA